MERLKKFLFSNTSVKQTIAKNTFWLLTSDIISRFFKLGLVIYAARSLGVANMGIFSYLVSLIGFFMIFSDTELTSLVTREISNDKPDKEKYVATIFLVKLILLAITIILIFSIAPLIANINGAKPLIGIATFYFISESLREFFLAINRGLQRMEREAVVKGVTNITVTIIGSVFLFLDPTVKNLLIAYCIGSFVGLSVAFIYIRTSLKNISKNFSKKLLSPIIYSLLPLALLSVFNGLLFNIDTIMLGWWSNEVSIGLYAAAQKIIQFICIVPLLFGSSIFPFLTQSISRQDKVRADALIKNSMRILIVFSLPIIVGGVLLRTQIMSTIFGESYIPGATAFAIIIFTLVLSSINSIFNYIAISHNQQKKFMRSIIVGTIINILLNLIFIPIYGINGSAVATVIAQLYIVISNWGITQRMNAFSHPFKGFFKIILAIIVLSGVIIGGLLIKMPLILIVITGGLVYTISLILLKEESIILVKDLLFEKKLPTNN